MSEQLEKAKKQFAVYLHQYGMFRDKTKSPDGKGFRLKLHETKPEAPLSPYYVNLRFLRSYPTTAKSTAVEIFREMMDGLRCDVLADVPTAITPVVSSLSDRTGIPMITPRAPKSHGDVGNIDGAYTEGAKVLLFDDLTTKADSKLESAKVLRSNDLVVTTVFVLLDREQGGRKRLETEGLSLHAAFTISELLQLYRDMGILRESFYQEIEEYQASQQMLTG